MNRFDLPNLINKNGCIAVELGVAAGSFSSNLINSKKFKKVIGIDSYSTPRHGIDEYREALTNTRFMFSDYFLLRMTFDEALPLFEDKSIDFLYIDGFAHLGQCGGKTIYDWAKKVKIGGIISGDDYDKDWPLVINSVDNFIKLNGFELNLTEKPPEDAPIYSQYRSWYTIKTDDIKGSFSEKNYKKYKLLEKIDKYKNKFKEIINYKSRK